MGHAENKRKRQEAIELRLLSTPTGLTPHELASLFNVDRSTIHRDLSEMQSSTELNLIKEGDRYRIDPASYARNVRLTNQEALTIYIALRRFIRQTSHAPTFFATAIQKIARALRHRSLVEALDSSTEGLFMRPASEQQTEVWNRLIQSWYERVVVRIEYRKGRQLTTEPHEFEPYLFEPAVLSQGVYVIGWSRTRNQLRTFKVDRIQHVALTTERFTADEALKPDDLLRHAWGVWYGAELKRVVLRFDPSVAARVSETIWHPSQKLQPQPDGSLLWSVEVAETLELVSWIRGWGHEVEVIEPAALRDEIAQSLRLAAARYW
jgi:predicted DNA-binding transcriptional regulator YafY